MRLRYSGPPNLARMLILELEAEGLTLSNSRSSRGIETRSGGGEMVGDVVDVTIVILGIGGVAFVTTLANEAAKDAYAAAKAKVHKVVAKVREKPGVSIVEDDAG